MKAALIDAKTFSTAFSSICCRDAEAFASVEACVCVMCIALYHTFCNFMPPSVYSSCAERDLDAAQAPSYTKTPSTGDAGCGSTLGGGTDNAKKKEKRRQTPETVRRAVPPNPDVLESLGYSNHFH